LAQVVVQKSKAHFKSIHCEIQMGFCKGCSGLLGIAFCVLLIHIVSPSSPLREIISARTAPSTASSNQGEDSPPFIDSVFPNQAERLSLNQISFARTEAHPIKDARYLKQTSRAGVVLWTYSRTGSTFFSNSWKRTTGDQFCNNVKESWEPKFQRVLTLEGLHRCIEQGQRYMHVKPEHLDGSNIGTRGDPWGRGPAYWIQHPRALRNASAFFRACAVAGFKVVVANYRANQFEAAVSSMEMTCARTLGKNNHVSFKKDPACVHSTAEARFCRGPPLVPHWENVKRVWLAGVVAAEQAGLTVVYSTFHELIADPCKVISRVQAVVPETQDEACVAALDVHSKNGQGMTSGDPSQKEERIGLEAWNCIIQQMETASDPSQYLWMLRQSTPPLEYRGWLSP